MQENTLVQEEGVVPIWDGENDGRGSVGFYKSQ